MASDWSFNVWRYGLVGLRRSTRLTKCSRGLAGFPVPPIYTNMRNGIGQAIAYYLPDEVLPDVYVEAPFFVTRPHFPYQFDVEPDLHT